MQPTWIVLADNGRARILQTRQPGRDLEEVEEFTDAAAHAHNADFRHDATGRRAPADSYGGAANVTTMAGNATASAGEDKLDHEAERFARQVAERLVQAKRQQRYERLRIVAAPKFLGRLRKVLPQEVSEAVVDEIDKDLLQLDRRELTQRLYPGDGRA
ncbi:MAG: host attachment protein [Pseudomonadota bacterium]